MNLTVGSHGFHVSLTLVALVAGAVAGAVWWAGRGNPAYDAWLASAQQEVGGTRAWRARDAVRAAAAAAERASARRLADSTARLTSSFDSVMHVLGSMLDSTKGSDAATVLGVASAACHAAIHSCEQEVAHWTMADSVDRERADSNARGWFRADSLLTVGIAVKECQINLGLIHPGCPSRTAMFGLGGVLGAIIQWLLHR